MNVMCFLSSHRHLGLTKTLTRAQRLPLVVSVAPTTITFYPSFTMPFPISLNQNVSIWLFHAIKLQLYL